MEFVANKGKNVEITVNGTTYMRHAIKTHFVNQGEDYMEIFRKYVSPIYEEGDIVSSSEKIISLCQNRVVRREELKVGFWARLLSKFASHPDSGVGVGETVKMQYAISKAGLPKVLAASVAGGVCKLFGKKGVFYEIVGNDVAGLDGFYDRVWEQYRDIGIENPENPSGVCDEIKENLGMSCMIVDANDLGQEVLGYSYDITLSEEELQGIISDNPCGQEQQTTPIVLIRKKT